MPKQPEDFLYEYVITCNELELASYFSDAVPPAVGTLIDPWEFTPKEHLHKIKGPFIVMDIDQRPKKTDAGDISNQTFVYIRVETP